MGKNSGCLEVYLVMGELVLAYRMALEEEGPLERLERAFQSGAYDGGAHSLIWTGVASMAMVAIVSRSGMFWLSKGRNGIRVVFSFSLKNGVTYYIRSFFLVVV